MLAKFLDTSSWDYQQWLASIIMAFVIVAVAVLLHRITQIFRMSRRPTYKPNLRPLRRVRIPKETRSESQETESQKTETRETDEQAKND